MSNSIQSFRNCFASTYIEGMDSFPWCSLKRDLQNLEDFFTEEEVVHPWSEEAQEKVRYLINQDSGPFFIVCEFTQSLNLNLVSRNVRRCNLQVLKPVYLKIFKLFKSRITLLAEVLRYESVAEGNQGDEVVLRSEIHKVKALFMAHPFLVFLDNSMPSKFIFNIDEEIERLENKLNVLFLEFNLWNSRQKNEERDSKIEIIERRIEAVRMMLTRYYFQVRKFSTKMFVYSSFLHDLLDPISVRKTNEAPFSAERINRSEICMINFLEYVYNSQFIDIKMQRLFVFCLRNNVKLYRNLDVLINIVSFFRNYFIRNLFCNPSSCILHVNPQLKFFAVSQNILGQIRVLKKLLNLVENESVVYLISKLFFFLGQYNQQNGYFEKAAFWYKKAADFCLKERLFVEKKSLLERSGSCFLSEAMRNRNKGDPEKKAFFYEMAASCYQGADRITCLKDAAMCFENIGYKEGRLGNLKRSVEFYEKASLIYEQISESIKFYYFSKAISIYEDSYDGSEFYEKTSRDRKRSKKSFLTELKYLKKAYHLHLYIYKLQDCLFSQVDHSSFLNEIAICSDVNRQEKNMEFLTRIETLEITLEQMD